MINGPTDNEKIWLRPKLTLAVSHSFYYFTIELNVNFQKDLMTGFREKPLTDASMHTHAHIKPTFLC